jgi:hypothetical protein
LIFFQKVSYFHKHSIKVGKCTYANKAAPDLPH